MRLSNGHGSRIVDSALGRCHREGRVFRFERARNLHFGWLIPFETNHDLTSESSFEKTQFRKKNLIKLTLRKKNYLFEFRSTV